MEFTPDEKIRAILPLVEAMFREVLYDEEPLFVGDEASLLDVSMADPQELMRRCLEYYKTPISDRDLRTPLWQLIPGLERNRLSRL